MKSAVLTLINIVALALFVGCAGKEGKKTTTKIVVGNLAGVETQTGGVMIYGNNLATGDNFGKVYNDAPMELSNGPWEFLIISYDGNGAGDVMEGVLRCGQAFADLTGGESSVSLSLAQANCSDPMFGTAGSKNGDQPWPLTLWSCMNPKAVDNRDGSECEKGVAGSHRIILPEFLNNGATGGGLVSNCITHSASADQLSSVIVPFFEIGFGGIPFQVRSFTDSTCTSPPDIYTFDIGHKAPSFPSYGTALSESGSSNNVYLFKNPCDTALYGTGATPFAFTSPDIGAANLICSPGQMENYMTSNPTLNYVLGRDIDFGGATITGSVVDANFSGLLAGNKRTISNVTIDCSGATNCGFFQEVSAAGSTSIMETNFFNIDVIADGSSSFVGGVVGLMSGGSNLRQIKVDDITITATGAPVSIGGVIGATSGTNEGIDTSLVKNVSLDIEEATGVGGVIGDAGDNDYIRTTKLENIFINTETNGGAGASAVGGVVGNVSASASQFEIWDVFLEYLYAGDTANPLEIDLGFGGMVGTAGSTRIYNSGVLGYADIEGTGNTIAGEARVGGFIGSANLNYDISEVLNSLTIDTVSYGANGGKVGGIIGYTYVTGGSSMSQVRNHGVIDCYEACGGLVGYLDHNGGATSISEAINYSSITSAGSNTGGLVGYANNVNILDSVNRGTVRADADVGGIVGVLNASVDINKSINGGDVITENGNAGGLVGSYIGATGSCNNTISYGDVLDFSGNGSSTLKELVGDDVPADFSATNCPYFDLGHGETLDTGTGTFSELASSTSTLLGGGGLNFDILNDANSEPIFVDDVNGLKTTYEASMEKLGSIYLGSPQDPFPIYTEAEWNSISDDPFLMNKALRLENYLYFNSTDGNFEPIGSATNCFSGHFQGNDYGLYDILVDESGGGLGPLGVFRSLCSVTSSNTAKIDHYDEFENIDYYLYIDNAEFYSDSFNTGVLAGEVADANTGSHWGTEAITIYGVFISYGIADTASTGNAGGVAGYVNFVNAQSEFENVDVFGTTVTAAGSGAAGGIAGEFTGTPSTPPDRNRFNLLNFTWGTVTAAGRAGGAVGMLSNGNVEVTRILVSDTDITGEGAIGGIVGTSYGENNIVEAVVKYTTLTDGNTAGYVGGILGEAQKVSAPIAIENSYAYSIDITGDGTLGGIAGVSAGAGGTLDFGQNYAIVNSVTGGGTFGGILGGTPSGPAATEISYTSYYYLDGSAHGAEGTPLAAAADINNGAIVTDLLLGTEYLLYGLDHPQKPFEIFRDLFLQ